MDPKSLDQILWEAYDDGCRRIEADLRRFIGPLQQPGSTPVEQHAAARMARNNLARTSTAGSPRASKSIRTASMKQRCKSAWRPSQLQGSRGYCSSPVFPPTCQEPAEWSTSPVPSTDQVFSAYRRPVDNKITPVQEFLQRTVAEEMRASGEYIRIGMNMKLSKFSGQRHRPDIRPDDIGLTADGKIMMIEIISPKQQESDLVDKLTAAMSQLRKRCVVCGT